jgi:hypothetical protein
MEQNQECNKEIIRKKVILSFPFFLLFISGLLEQHPEPRWGDVMPVEKVGDCYVWKCPYCDFRTKAYRRYETAVNQGIKHMVKMHEREVLMSG